MNVAMHLSRAARIHRDRLAIRDADRRLSFAQLEERCNRLAHALAAMGVRHGDRVALALPNSVEWIELEFAIAKLGAMTVPISIRTHAREMARMIEFSECSQIITTPAVLSQFSGFLQNAELPALLVADPGESGYEAAILRSPAEPVCVNIDQCVDGRVMRFTSGTTGNPKGVFLTHENWMAITSSYLLDSWNLQPEDVVLSTSPYAHAGGLWIVAAFIRGASISIFDKFDAAALLAQIMRDNVTVLQIVPTALRRLLDLPGVTREDFAGLRSVSYGGAGVSASTLADAFALIGPKLSQEYGLNEAAAITTLAHEDHRIIMGEQSWRQPIGREKTLAEVTIRDPAGNVLPDNETGEIVVRGPMVFREYWKNPAATAETKKDGESLWTGDLGFRDSNGILYMAGRIKEIIITGGYNVSPQEVEAVLDQHEAVHQCAVVGEPDAEWGERVVAFVVLGAGKAATEDDLIDFCREYLTSYKKPKAIRFVEALPVNSNGKVQRRLLLTAGNAGDAST